MINDEWMIWQGLEDAVCLFLEVRKYNLYGRGSISQIECLTYLFILESLYHNMNCAMAGAPCIVLGTPNDKRHLPVYIRMQITEK